MSPPAAPGVTREITHPACGTDNWHFRKTWRCKTCDRKTEREWKARQYAENPAILLYKGAKQRAARAGDPFDITVADVERAWPADGCCPALGIPLRAGGSGRGGPADASPTLDRLNNSWHYAAGNIAVISYAANRAKGQLTAAELERIAAWMRRSGLH